MSCGSNRIFLLASPFWALVYTRLLKSLARVELLILDDWGLAPLTSQQGRDLLEIVDDRHGRGSTIVTSQLPVDHWHEVIVDPTIADAVLDRASKASRSPAKKMNFG
jgi:DNA replication protein DnaC